MCLIEEGLWSIPAIGLLLEQITLSQCKITWKQIDTMLFAVAKSSV